MIYGFERKDDESTISVIINNDTKSNKIRIPFVNDLVLDLISGTEYAVDNGMLNIELPPMSGVILK